MDPFAPKLKKTTRPQPQNFVEALKSIGGQTVSSLGHDVIGGVGRDALNSIFGGSPRSADGFYPDQTQAESALSQERLWRQAMERQARLKEVQTTPIYDRREEEVKAQIKALQDQLKALAKDLTHLSLSAQKAIDTEIAHPGQYHVAFFEKLRRFILLLRQQVNDANSWLEASYARRRAKQFFWGGVQKSGTKFLLSQERQVAISAG
ncbi:hypothetical protein A2W24_04790 [Microgenomates group bacterium RBG_16_45_19]|nr:MAG: hypothetical protein A2W24_04790 [Microgenomates group bacterium RBG_16_45_19]